MSEELLKGEQEMPRGDSRPRHSVVASGEAAAITATPKPGVISAPMDHKIFVRPAVGVAARIVQHNRLRYSNIVINRPVIILVEHGTKILRNGDYELTIKAGGAVALCQDQVFDVINAADAAGAYQARWIAFDPDLVLAQSPPASMTPPIERALALKAPERGFLDAYRLATEAIATPDSVPEAIAVHRVKELLIWLDLSGGRFTSPRPGGFAPRVRALLMSEPAEDWSGAGLCGTLGVSEATLRRKLSAEGWSFQSLLADVRMSVAMQLLQSTNLSVLHIAQEVGYESQSRFALRFRARFGFAPSAIRGHKR
ncbi:helix-turn-helix transcriptional regulator [Rhizobium herbae]|uniref:AraC-like DNA-binding protein n=1 Tax=Rhizobium herbae TaxID=508661 RepID=A0ABS4ET87_9HYPH|nr:helix-turn-helix transcriptional regulator [Rhizobium herbae]MBP1861153.1 AraC-like DNA-binding protein [Rhizobium herbae]